MKTRLSQHIKLHVLYILYRGGDRGCKGSRSVPEALPANVPRRLARMQQSGLPDTPIRLPRVTRLSSHILTDGRGTSEINLGLTHDCALSYA